MESLLEEEFEQKGGTIINITSITVLRGTQPELLDAIGYSTAKAGIVGFTKDLSVCGRSER